MGRRINGERDFWAKVAVSKVNDACWFWNGTVDGGGYGHFKYDHKEMLAHRYAYTITYGAIPKGLVVRHKCNNPNCANPAHLELGTKKQNSQDAVKAGAYKRRGCIGHKRAKEAALLMLTGTSMLQIAHRLQVSFPSIQQIKNGISYRAAMKEAIEELQNKSVSHPAKNELTPS